MLREVAKKVTIKKRPETKTHLWTCVDSPKIRAMEGTNPNPTLTLLCTPLHRTRRMNEHYIKSLQCFCLKKYCLVPCTN